MVRATEQLSADEAFWLLGEETRLAILRSVWAADEAVSSFSEIRERIGSPDSGQFNYHLGQLKGPFVTEVEDGYRLTQAGREVVRAVMAGTLTERPETAPRPIGADCVECGGDLVFRYDEYGIVECSDCGATLMWNEFPPAGLADRASAEMARAFDRWTQHRFRLAMDGVCPNCAVSLSTSVLNRNGEAGDPASLHRCSNCKYEARVPLPGHVLGHPAVISFLYGADIDVTSMPYWEWRALAATFDETVVSTDPWRARVTIEAGGRVLELTLDEAFDVITVEPPDP